MILQLPLVLIKNNLKAWYSINYIKELFSTIGLFITTFTLPIIILEYLANLSNNSTINRVCYNIYYILYYTPSLIIIYTIHNSKLSRLLEKKYKLYYNPTHCYLTLLYGFMYIICLILSNISNIILIRYICETFSCSLFFNEVAYSFLDNRKYIFNNKIDFYNANWTFFIVYSGILTYIINKIPYQIFIPVSYFISGIFLNGLIYLDYNHCKSSINIYNLLYPFERLFNILVTGVSGVIFYSLRNRTIIDNHR